MKGLKLWRFDNTISEFGAYFHCACAEMAIWELRSKIWPRHSLRRPRFPLRSDVYGIYSLFLAPTSHNLVTLTFDLLTLRASDVQFFSLPTHIPIYIILRLSVPELRILNIWSHFCYLKQSLRMRHVTWPITEGGGKNGPHFWNPRPQFAYSLCHFQGATTKIKPCYWRK